MQTSHKKYEMYFLPENQLKDHCIFSTYKYIKQTVSSLICKGVNFVQKQVLVYSRL